MKLSSLSAFLSFAFVLLLSCGDQPDAEESENHPGEQVTVEQKIEVSELTKISMNDIPDGISYNGEFTDAYQFDDANGSNYLIRSMGAETITETEYSDREISQELHIAYYVVKEGVAEQHRTVLDFVKDCPFDVVIHHLEDAVYVSDLDEDGIGEIVFLYRTACTSDVSPSDQKLLLLEAGDKYIIRGTAGMEKTEWMEEIPSTYEVGGELEGNELFKDRAVEIWKMHELEAF